MATAQALLTKLETAIEGFLDGGAVQAYTFDGLTVTVANIDSLMKMRDQLRQEAANASGRQEQVNYFRKGKVR